MISAQAIVTIILLVLTIIALSAQWIRSDLMALLVLLILVVGRILTPDEAFSAFSQPVIIIIASVFVIGAALLDTGIATMIADRILRFGRYGELVLMLVVMLIAALLTAFLDGLLVVALLLPAVLKVAGKANLSPSRLLLPLATIATIGNPLTLIGTASNLVVNDILVSGGAAGLGLFGLTPYALASVGVAMAWYLTAGRRLLSRELPVAPARPSLTDVEQSYQLRNQLYRLRVRSSSDLIAGSLATGSKLRLAFNLNVIAVQPHGDKLQPAGADYILEQDDILVVEGDIGRILQAANAHGLESKGAVSLEAFNQHGLSTLRMAELMVPIRSPMIGRSLSDIGFRRRYGLNVLAVHRQGETIRKNLPNLPLAMGDSLLAQGAPESLRNVGLDLGLIPVTDLGPQQGDLITEQARYALIVLAAMLGLVMLNVVSLATAGVAAAAILILLKCTSLERAYQSINLSLLVLVGGMLSLSFAMQKTGAAALIAGFIATAGQIAGPAGSLAVMFILTGLVAQVIGGAVAAALFTPIAVGLAATLNAPPQPFAIATAMAVLAGYVTPLTDGDNLLVRDPGRYTIRDYVVNTVPIFLLQTVALMTMLVIGYRLY